VLKFVFEKLKRFEFEFGFEKKRKRKEKKKKNNQPNPAPAPAHNNFRPKRPTLHPPPSLSPSHPLTCGAHTSGASPTSSRPPPLLARAAAGVSIPGAAFPAPRRRLLAFPRRSASPPHSSTAPSSPKTARTEPPPHPHAINGAGRPPTSPPPPRPPSPLPPPPYKMQHHPPHHPHHSPSFFPARSTATPWRPPELRPSPSISSAGAPSSLPRPLVIFPASSSSFWYFSRAIWCPGGQHWPSPASPAARRRR
jgi:hypothetical protein